MFNLVPASVVYESDFLTTYFEYVIILIEFGFLLNLLQSTSHTADAVSVLKFIFDDLLVDYVSFIISDNKKDPWIL